MYDDVALVILSLSCISTFFTVAVRIYRWDELVDTTNRAARLLLCLALSDFIAALTWAFETHFAFCPQFMVFKYFGFTSACIFTNCVGIQLVSMIHRKHVPEKYYFIASYILPIIMTSLWLSLHLYNPVAPPVTCWFPYTFDLLMWRTIQMSSFAINAIVFGYVSWRIFRSQKAWQLAASLQDKERRLYLIIICFLVPTVGAIAIGTLLVTSQGLLNSIAMNEKALHDFVKEQLEKWRTRNSKTPRERQSTHSRHSTHSAELILSEITSAPVVTVTVTVATDIPLENISDNNADNSENITLQQYSCPSYCVETYLGDV